jgi:hypothetical protein
MIKNQSSFQGDFSSRVELRLASSRAHFSSALAIIATGLSIYVLFAIGYHHLVGPAVNTAVLQAAPTHSAASAAPPQRQSPKPMRFASEGHAATPSTAERPTSMEEKNESTRAVDRRGRSGRNSRNSGQFAFLPFNGFRPWF